jgi:hypothetical protein
VVEARTITLLANSDINELAAALGKNPQYAPAPELVGVGPIVIKHEPAVVVFSRTLTLTNHVPAVREILRPVVPNVVVTAAEDDNEAWT